MSVQVKHRRDTAANISGFTPAQGEIIMATDTGRLILGDGATAGGIPYAKLSEVGASPPTRTPIADASYTALTTDRNIAYTSITAARTVTLCAASAFPVGYRLSVFDESGAASATNTITVARAGSDTINGATSASISSAYGVLALESNGASKWTLIDLSASNLPAVGIGTAADPSNPLSVYGASALFNGANFSFTVNKSASGNTASVLFQDGFSARAQIGLLGSDNFSFKVSPNGSTFTTGLIFDATTGAPTFGNQRTAVSDTNYTALATDREVAYTAITAGRTVTLPAASAFPAGHPLVIVDESGAAGFSTNINVTRAGSDTISGRTTVSIFTPYGHVRLVSDGSSKWTVIGRSANYFVCVGVGSTFYTPSPGLIDADVFLVGGGGGGGAGALQLASTVVSGGGGGGGGGAARGTFTAAQIAAVLSGGSLTITVGAGGLAGVAATTSTTAGGSGGVGGSTTFGSLLTATGGGGGAGGQLGGGSGGGQGGNSTYAAGSSGSGASGGNNGTGLAAGGSAGFGTGSGYYGIGGGGSGCSASGSSNSGPTAIAAPAGGASGGGITAANAPQNGANGGASVSVGTYGAGGASAGASGATAATPPSGRALDLYFAGGGGGGAGSLTAAGAGGGGGVGGGGGGGGGSAQNGGTAGAGGTGGIGYAVVIEYF